MEKSEQIHIRLSTQDKEDLFKLAQLKDMNISELIRKWIDLYRKSWLSED